MNTDSQGNYGFSYRHIGPDATQVSEMLKTIGAGSLDELIDQTIPGNIRLSRPLELPEPLSEAEFIASFSKMMDRNQIFRSYIGTGYYNCHTPAVIRRNILENPGWYTAYTPYQAEISQGRLEALINFQTVIIELTGLPLANASLLDEATAAAEAMQMLFAARKGNKAEARRFFVDRNTFPQTLDVLRTRAVPTGIQLHVNDIDTLDLSDPDLYGVYLQYPDNNGAIRDHQAFIEKAHANGVMVAMGVDLLGLVLLKSPGEMGADVVVGSAQRFGVPMGYGGPHAAFFATREEFKRNIPGRIIGVSVDASGKPGYRMALQTREQHIRRERATSNICTAQVLLSVMAGMYAVYHGPEGLRRIASEIHRLATTLDQKLRALGFEQRNEHFFDTLKVAVSDPDKIRAEALKRQINFRYFPDGHVGISLDETTTPSDVDDIIAIFSASAPSGSDSAGGEVRTLPGAMKRSDAFLTHPVFNKYRSEHEMLRYLKRLENKDLSMVHSMIPLGSCTMKLNATTEMTPITWPELADIHPFVPVEQAAGYQEMIRNLEAWLREITGFSGVSLQPNSGAQGEFTGLMVIRAYHQSRGDERRNIALIPASAHGTNPASAVMAGMKVVVVKSDADGKVDVDDLRQKAEAHKTDLACLMITYPSTHGVFEERIVEMCDIVHENGGMVYMDGANMNAQVGLTSPARIGADVCHLNLHKTFCIPHGGGGPGMGPVCANEALAPFLPGHAEVQTGGSYAIHAVSAAPWGSASILAISYAYIAMMGAEGLTDATRIAILNANYIKSRLEGHYPTLYAGANGRCAHEMIIDCRSFKKAGIEVEDIAKRLMDYGFHAPTVSFPVPGTLMIEPTESETREELDRFCDAMVEIRNEIREVEEGLADRERNVLKNAPHTAAAVTADEWDMPYSRSRAAYPLPFVTESKYWPPIGRIDNAYGDRNLVCSCIPVDAYDTPNPVAV